MTSSTKDLIPEPFIQSWYDQQSALKECIDDWSQTEREKNTSLEERGRKKKSSILVAVCRAESFIHSFKNVNAYESHPTLEVVLKSNSPVFFIFLFFSESTEGLKQRRDLVWLLFGGRWVGRGLVWIVLGRGDPGGGGMHGWIVKEMYARSLSSTFWKCMMMCVDIRLFLSFDTGHFSSLLVWKTMSRVLRNCLELFFDYSLPSILFLFPFFLECPFFRCWISLISAPFSPILYSLLSYFPLFLLYFSEIVFNFIIHSF